MSPDEEKVISLHYSRDIRDEIHAQTGISTGKISNIIASEKARLGAANVDAIRRIGQEIIKKGKAGGSGVGGPTSWLDIANAFAALNFYEKHNFDFEEIKNDLPEVIKKCVEYKIKLRDVPKDIEDKVKSIAELEAKKNFLQKEIDNLEQARIQKLRMACHTDESLAKCRQMSDFVTKNGLSFDAPKNLKNVFNNAEEAGYNAKVLVQKISSIDSLNIEKASLEETIKKLKREQQENNETTKKQQLEIRANSEMLKETAELKNMGYNVIVLKAIKEVVKKVVATHNEMASTTATKMMTEEQATEKFMTDILTRYEPLAGFESAIAAKQKEKAELEANIEKLRIRYAKDSDTVDAVRVLYENEVKPADILAIKYLAEKEGSNLPALRSKIVINGSLDNTIAKLEKRVKDLDISVHLNMRSLFSRIRKQRLEIYSKMVLVSCRKQ